MQVIFSILQAQIFAKQSERRMVKEEDADPFLYTHILGVGGRTVAFGQSLHLVF